MKTYWVWWKFVNNAPKQPMKIEADTVDEAIEKSIMYDPKVRSPSGERVHFFVFQQVVCAGAMNLVVVHNGPVDDEPTFMELLFGGSRDGSKEE